VHITTQPFKHKTAQNNSDYLQTNIITYVVYWSGGVFAGI